MLNCILIIDDDGVTRQLYSMILSDMQVAEKIGTFSYGAHALEFIDTYIPDIILIDINMPGMDGFEVIEELNENPIGQRLKLLLCQQIFELSRKKN